MLDVLQVEVVYFCSLLVQHKEREFIYHRIFDNIFKCDGEVLICNLLSDILLFLKLYNLLICVSIDEKQLLIEYEVDICLLVVGTWLYRTHCAGFPRLQDVVVETGQLVQHTTFDLQMSQPLFQQFQSRFLDPVQTLGIICLHFAMRYFGNRQIQLPLIDSNPDRFHKKPLIFYKLMEMFELHNDDVIGFEQFIDVVDEFGPIFGCGPLEAVELLVCDWDLEHAVGCLPFDFFDQEIYVLQADFAVYQGLELQDLVDFLEDHKNPLVLRASIGDSQLKVRILSIPIGIDNLLVLIHQLKHIMRIGPHRI